MAEVKPVAPEHSLEKILGIDGSAPPAPAPNLMQTDLRVAVAHVLDETNKLEARGDLSSLHTLLGFYEEALASTKATIDELCKSGGVDALDVHNKVDAITTEVASIRTKMLEGPLALLHAHEKILGKLKHGSAQPDVEILKKNVTVRALETVAKNEMEAIYISLAANGNFDPTLSSLKKAAYENAQNHPVLKVLKDQTGDPEKFSAALEMTGALDVIRRTYDQVRAFSRDAYRGLVGDLHSPLNNGSLNMNIAEMAPEDAISDILVGSELVVVPGFNAELRIRQLQHIEELMKNGERVHFLRSRKYEHLVEALAALEPGVALHGRALEGVNPGDRLRIEGLIGDPVNVHRGDKAEQLDRTKILELVQSMYPRFTLHVHDDFKNDTKSSPVDLDSEAEDTQ